MAFDPADYRNEIILAGGDFTVELFSQGVSPSGIWERIHLDRPDIVQSIAEAFFDAGATVLVTNTDRVNSLIFAEALESGNITSEEIAALNREWVAAFRLAADKVSNPKRMVFGAIGPVGSLLVLNEVDENALIATYRLQAEALAAGGVDAILCRSFTEVQALSAAVKGAKEGADLPVVGSMRFDCGPDYTETTMGVTVPQACQAMLEAGVCMVGCDRGEFPDGAVAVVKLFRESCDFPIWVEINAGQAELEEDRSIYPESPKTYGERFKPIAEAGATMLCGGYGASVEHIAELARVRENYLKRAKRQRMT